MAAETISHVKTARIYRGRVFAGMRSYLTECQCGERFGQRNVALSDSDKKDEQLKKQSVQSAGLNRISSESNVKAAMKLRMPGITNDQPTTMASFDSTLFTLWSFVLPRMSRNIIFHFRMLLVP